MEHTEEHRPPNVITSDTNNATTIQPSEAPPDQRAKYRRLRAYNTGTWNGPRREVKEVVHRQDDLHRYDAISSSLELTQTQKNRGRKVFNSVDLGSVNNKDEGVDEVAFAVCVLVANHYVRDGTRYWPHPDGGGDELFESVAEDIGLSLDEQMSIVVRIRSRVDL